MSLAPTSCVLLTHLSHDCVERMCDYWLKLMPNIDLVVVYGGPKQQFDQINYTKKTFIDSSKLKTRDHQRENQSYVEVYQAAAAAIAPTSTHVYFTEFDHVPSSPVSLEVLLRIQEQKDADLLTFDLKRIDQTNAPHYLWLLDNQPFFQFLKTLSKRVDKQIILTSPGYGHLWRRDAFDAFVAVEDKYNVYLEIWLPTVAHHLGYRVQPVGSWQEWNTTSGSFDENYDDAVASSVEWVHPVKNLWKGEK